MSWSWSFHGYLSLFHLGDILKLNNVLCVIYIHTHIIVWSTYTLGICYIRVQVVEAWFQCVNMKSGNLKRLIIVSSYTTGSSASRRDEHSSYGWTLVSRRTLWLLLYTYSMAPSAMLWCSWELSPESESWAYLNLDFGLPNLWAK